MSNTYAQKTKVLGIPVRGEGDKLNPQLERKRWQIVENMLLAATKGMKNCLLEEGELLVEKENEAFYVSRLLATGQSPSACGVAGGAYFVAPPELSWKGLTKGYNYYLYLETSNRTFEDSSAVRPVSSKFELENRYMVLIGRIDLRGDKVVVQKGEIDG